MSYRLLKLSVVRRNMGKMCRVLEGRSVEGKSWAEWHRSCPKCQLFNPLCPAINNKIYPTRSSSPYFSPRCLFFFFRFLVSVKRALLRFCCTLTWKRIVTQRGIIIVSAVENGCRNRCMFSTIVFGCQIKLISLCMSCWLWKV